jgi:hypothetical protein
VYFIVLVAGPFEFLPPLLQSLRLGKINRPALGTGMAWCLALLVWALLYIVA